MARAGWFKGTKAMEDVIPLVWIDKDQKGVHWPTWECGSSYMNRHPVPESDWQRFPLTKVKYEDDEY